VIGHKHRIGLIVFTTWARTTTLPRRLSTFYKVTINDAELFSEARVHLATWLRILLHQASDATGCVPDKKCETTRPVVRMIGYSPSGISADGRHSIGLK